ncbi:TPA: hypothetical protein DCP77_01095 [Candidatus Collierbacteria bacterium]|uniref:Uncharacterized protein n=1 Tax=Candidatus Collierbacteria bacterium GW2011_GWA2_42_17 TaxID=1618378 RepID=A0A0G1BYP6_9BACT|nr:MAG: hypothetical protein UU94_C0011G0007 [Candidatus Collierbacteria bacterium GW2011_GWB2_42_12]KKS42548.1 MAG: hypothetical protein UV06_C0010G0008 [Candidatus Collierbacteria bacterium GW2011_GWA2_42_17]KKS62129.1 MAG: hypothetical protein UV28_C0017G0007 [Candidatus Collierbacteria bacterium GW2011_GWE2_42_48]KKS67118.1 MAG: hypothetical protein UV37_C0011G0008 [Candidatus Collierbacteria bacterium GW2011_GWA1_42_60]HAI22454.1 hypothetical protein [Candidatus Collierbacteria bacterium]
MKVIYLITLIFLSIFFTTTEISLVYADDLKSPTFEIQMGTINITGGAKSSTTYKLTDTVGQTFQGQFNSAGYVILAGFQYINTLIPFSFKISDLDINFGSLVPGIPSLLSNTLTVTTGSAFGYAVKAIEDHPLRRSDGVTTIPDTSCDLATPCLQADANVWGDNARFGFGYNMSGTDVNIADFVNSTYYRPFPVENIDQPAIVMSKGGIATSSAATVTYKVNISGSQAAGTYQNAIQFIAIPAF